MEIEEFMPNVFVPDPHFASELGFDAPKTLQLFLNYPFDTFFDGFTFVNHWFDRHI